MSIISGQKTIFCEGKQNSLDYKLLNRVIKGIGHKCTIVPAGSKFTFSVFASGYFSQVKSTNQRYIVFRDRDFDAKPNSKVQLVPLYDRASNKVFLSYRACIENYLLDANLLHNYWVAKYTEKLENPSSRWGHGDSPGVEAIAAWIEDSARNLQDYQSVRWALGDLLRMSASRQQLKTTWTKGSGELPAFLSLQDCKTEALELINQFKQAIDTVTIEEFEASLSAYVEKFQQDDFWIKEEYLIWFDGKDIQKEMQRQKSQYPALKAFFDWAVTELEISQHPDLIELRTKIEQL